MKNKRNIQFKTFGCRLNSFETEVMGKIAKLSDSEDVTVINTCAVTNEAVRKAKKTIRKMKRTTPGNKIYVTGCAAQVEPKTFSSMPEVHRVFGNVEKLKKEFWSSQSKDNEKIKISDIMKEEKVASHSVDGLGTRARAYVQIQNGCDHRCTFCIIPFGRGNSRSIPSETIVQQVRRLINKGFKEVVLTGVDITSWGLDLDGSPKLSFLINEILKSNKDLARLRLSSIDQIELDSEFIPLFTNEERLMPHLHLSIQSGDNMILKRMKRRHTRENIIEFCEKIRTKRNDVRFGADIIAGFPTETDKMFENSLKLADECELTWLHVFPFSPKTGTPAARMPQVDTKLINERASALREKGNIREAIHNKSLIGKDKNLLMESSNIGRTECFTRVYTKAEVPSGTLVNANITDTILFNKDKKLLTATLI